MVSVSSKAVRCTHGGLLGRSCRHRDNGRSVAPSATAPNAWVGPALRGETHQGFADSGGLGCWS